MNPLISIDGLTGWLAVSTPIALLIAVALQAFWRGRWRARKADRVEEEALLPAGVSEADVDLAGDTVTRASHGDVTAIGAPPVPVDEGRRKVIAEEIAAAECAGDRSHLMQLLLELALVERNAGDVEAAKVLLRKSIMIASETGDAVVHASARLELGDIAESQGDLTTACEHWQMARALFDQAERADERRETEARMRSRGCPTDWVLTDF